jgi:hypothetical protein
MEPSQIITLAAMGAHIAITGLGLFKWRRQLNPISVALGFVVIACYVWRAIGGEATGWYVAAWVGITALNVAAMVVNRRTARRFGGAS